MSDELTREERVQQQTRGNLLASFAMSFGYLKEKGEPLEKFGRYAADKIRPMWKGVETPKQFCDAMALNYESFGSKILDIEGDEEEAKLTFSDYMTENILEAFDLSKEDVDSMHSFSEHLADKLGLSYEWEREGDNTTIRVRK